MKRYEIYYIWKVVLALAFMFGYIIYSVLFE